MAMEATAAGPGRPAGARAGAEGPPDGARRQTVCAVILNWNGGKSTLACLESLWRQARPGLEIVVVDNGSTDDSVGLIRAWCAGGPNPGGGPVPLAEVRSDGREGTALPAGTARAGRPGIVLLMSPENLGYSGGNNLGIRFAAGAMDPDYVLILNNDLVVGPGFLDRLLEAARSSPGIGMWQSKVLRAADRRTLSGAGIGIFRSGQTYVLGAGEPDGGATGPGREIFGIYGCGVMCDARMLEETGLVDEDLFAYFEDVDLSWRAQLHGWGCMYVPSAVSYHEESATGSRIKGVLNIRNGILCFVKVAPAALALRKIVDSAAEVLRFLVSAPPEEKRRCLGVIARFGFASKLPAMFRKRGELRVARAGNFHRVQRWMGPPEAAGRGRPGGENARKDP